MRPPVFTVALLLAVFAAAPLSAQTACDDHLQITGVAVWDQTEINPLIRDKTSLGNRCFYYVNRNGSGAQEVVLEFQADSPKVVTAVEVNEGSGVVPIGGLSRSGRVYKQRLLLGEQTASYRVTLRDTSKGAVEIRLHAPRRPVLTLRPPSAGCGSGGTCLIQDRANLVEIEGNHLDQIDLMTNATAGNDRFPITLDDGHWFLSVTPTASTSFPINVTIPLRTQVASTESGAFTLVPSISVPLNAAVTTPRSVLELYPANTDSPLTLAYAGSVLSVRFSRPSSIALDSTYLLVETPQDTATPLATLSPYADDPTDPWRLARLRVNSPSRLAMMPGSPPLLYVMNGKRIVGTTTLAVRPRPRVERAEVVRGATVSQNLYLHPAETATVYLAGPSVGAFETVQPADPQVSVQRSEPLPGRLQLAVTTPRKAVPYYDVRLVTTEGIDTVIRFESRPQQRPRELNFGRMHWAAGNTDGIRLDSVGEIEPLRSLEGTRLVFNSSSVDDVSGVYGVQYLLLKAKLVDHTGAVVDSSVYRIAVRPTGDLPYTVEAGYVQTSEVDIDALLSESPLHTKAHSRLMLSLQHDPERYPGSRPPAPVSAQMQHSGRLVVEPSFTLPTGMYVVADGFSPQIATMLSGAFLDFTYFPFADRRRALPVNFRLGIMAVDPTFLPPGSRRAKLAPTGLLNYTIATVRRNLSLSVSAGAMYLNRHTASDLWEREDFFLLFSPGISYSIR